MSRLPQFPSQDDMSLNEGDRDIENKIRKKWKIVWNWLFILNWFKDTFKTKIDIRTYLPREEHRLKKNDIPPLAHRCASSSIPSNHSDRRETPLPPSCQAKNVPQKYSRLSRCICLGHAWALPATFLRRCLHSRKSFFQIHVFCQL